MIKDVGCDCNSRMYHQHNSPGDPSHSRCFTWETEKQTSCGLIVFLCRERVNVMHKWKKHVYEKNKTKTGHTGHLNVRKQRAFPKIANWSVAGRADTVHRDSIFVITCVVGTKLFLHSYVIWMKKKTLRRQENPLKCDQISRLLLVRRHFQAEGRRSNGRGRDWQQVEGAPLGGM